ncbi:hypothetical protein [Fulvivirga lutea]|uniref:Uncharacterized protein n=1 Tax=Fulvivirga lutea TaxID=2810512 RepID=A0A975A1W5_9BACT|nr:hypothetical protein [Fulvivirga lutea]QSE98781.1 hypothetical protein JR347_06800 [Fulvivirga lutea]
MKVRNFNHLKELASKNDDMQHFYVILAGGLAKSGLRISYHRDSDTFDIIHEIDESHVELNSLELLNNFFFKEAIFNNCLFLSEID